MPEAPALPTRRGFRVPARAHLPDLARARLAEWSVVFLVASLFGTVAWKAYLVVMLLPTTLLYEVWRSDAAPDLRRGTALTLAASFALGGLTSDDLMGTSLAWRLKMGSIVTLAALVQLGGLLWLRWRLGEARPA